MHMFTKIVNTTKVFGHETVSQIQKDMPPYSVSSALSFLLGLKALLTVSQPCGSELALWCGPSCSFMVWRRRHTGGWGEALPIRWGSWGGPDGPCATRLSSPPITCSSSTLKEARWPQLSQKSPVSSSSPSRLSRVSSSLISLSSWHIPPAPLKLLLPRVPHTHTSIPESPVNRLLLPLGSRSLSSVQPSDKSFSRGSLQESSPLSLLFSWMESGEKSPSLLSPSDSSITPESCAVCMGLLSGFGLMSNMGSCGSSMLGLQHRLSETEGNGEGWMAVQCPSCCSGASGQEVTEVGPVCKAL